MAGVETPQRFEYADLVGTQFRFDTRRYPFAEFFLARVNEHLSRRDGRVVTSLERIHDAVAPESLGEFYDLLYDFETEPEFIALYRQYIEEYVAPLFDDRIRYQRKPGVRIHLPRTMTVQYHTDEWYGHGPNVLNFWTTLTAASGTSSLYVATLADSIAETQRLEHEKASMEEINGRLATITRPLDVRYGETFIFSTRTVHGTEINDMDQTRVSIDYRVMSRDGDPGSKNLDDYYALTASNDAPAPDAAASPRRSACTYIFPKHGFTRFIDSNHQRIVVNEVARANGMSIVGEETEIRTMSHHPQLLRIASGQGTYAFDTVVLFSVLCLPEDRGDRQRVYETARRSNVVLLFAVERVALPTSADIAAIELLRERQLELRDNG